jgi:CAAX prenyl protease-like protein
MSGEPSRAGAYLAPFAVFFAGLLLGELVAKFGDGYAHWAVAEPRYWVFPLQVFVCGLILWSSRAAYHFAPFRGFGFATFIGLAALGVWIAPQAVFHAAPRIEGFDPGRFGEGWPFWMNLALRLVRMVIIVPLLEEIFWRGFLLRYLVRVDFESVAFGTFTWKSFIITSVAFCFEHQPADWPAALLTGALFNLVAYRTRSLAACVLTHAVTNLALAIYILQTRQWGFW